MAAADWRKPESIFRRGVYVAKILLGLQTCERSECAAASRKQVKKERCQPFLFDYDSSAWPV